MPILYEAFTFPKTYAQVTDNTKTLTLIMAYPPNTILVADYITGKPLIGAQVTVDSTSYTTDSNGLFIPSLANGTYTVKITMHNYLTKTFTLTMPMTQPQTVKLIPYWAVGLGAAAGATVLLGIAATLKMRKT
jgi:hypothetical protein